MKIKKDLGIIYIDSIFKYYPYIIIKKYMEENGYDIDLNDICAITKGIVTKETVEHFFKFVHVSIPSMETEGYYRIVFKNKMSWRKVEDELPNDYQDVLVYANGSSYFVAYHSVSGNWMIESTSYNGCEKMLCSITHWMPLPIEPKIE